MMTLWHQKTHGRDRVQLAEDCPGDTWVERPDFEVLCKLYPNGHPWLQTMNKAMALQERVRRRESSLHGGGRPECATMEMVSTRLMLDSSPNFSMTIANGEVMRGDIRMVGPKSELARLLDLNPNMNPDLDRQLKQALGITKWDLWYLTGFRGQGGWLTSQATRAHLGGLLLHFSRTLRHMDMKDCSVPQAGFPMDVDMSDAIPLSEQRI